MWLQCQDLQRYEIIEFKKENKSDRDQLFITFVHNQSVLNI